MAVDVVDTRAGFDALERDWDRLFNADPESTPFQSFGWSSAFLDACHVRTPELLTLRLCERGSPRAILPLVRATSSDGRSVIHFLSSPCADVHDVVCDVDRDRAWGGLFGPLAAITLEGRTALELAELSERSLAHLRSASMSRDLDRVSIEWSPCSRSPYVLLSRVESLKPQTRRRHDRLVRAGCRIDFTVHASREAIVPKLDRFRSLFLDRWRDNPNSACFFEDSDRDFIAALVDRLAPQGLLRFAELTINDGAAAQYLLLSHRRAIYFYRSAFDPSPPAGVDRNARWYSPGILALELAMLHFSARGFERFELLRGAYPYKYRYAHGERVQWMMRMRAP